MSKNKELVAEAIAAIPLWIAFLDKKEAEQDALLAEMQGNKASPKTFIEKMTSRLKPKKEQPGIASNATPSEKKEALDSSVIPFANALPTEEELLDNNEQPPEKKLVASQTSPPEEKILDSAPSEDELRWAQKETNKNASIREEEREDEDEREEEEEDEAEDEDEDEEEEEDKDFY